MSGMDEKAGGGAAGKRFVEHANRHDWGRGIVESEFGGYVAVAFENGPRMKFSMETAALLKDVQVSEEDGRALVEKVQRASPPTPKPGLKLVSAGRASKGRRISTKTFDDQVGLFLRVFPKGFDDEKFIAEDRGQVGRSKRAAYKQGAIEGAKSLLAADVLSTALAQGRFSDVYEGARRVIALSYNLLHRVGEKAPLDNLPNVQHEAFARSLHDMLHGDGHVAARFDRFVDGLGLEKATWPQATILPAFFDPSSYFLVKPDTARAQAEIMGIELTYHARPNGEVYERLIGMARQVEARLVTRGLRPRDLMDVYSFTWLTLSKNAVMDAALVPAIGSNGSDGA